MKKLLEAINDPLYWENTKTWRKNLMRVAKEYEAACLHQHVCTICGLIWPCSEPSCSNDTTICVMAKHESEIPNSRKLVAQVSIQLCSECYD